jgi:hypothetical protein
MKGFKLGEQRKLHSAKSLEAFQLCNACSVVRLLVGVVANSWARDHDVTYGCQRIKDNDLNPFNEYASYIINMQINFN